MIWSPASGRASRASVLGGLRCRSPARRKTCDAHLSYSLPVLSCLSPDQADAMTVAPQSRSQECDDGGEDAAWQGESRLSPAPGTARSSAKAQETAKYRFPIRQ